MNPDLECLLASSSVVVCDWCGNSSGIWLELGVPLGVFTYWMTESDDVCSKLTTNS